MAVRQLRSARQPRNDSLPDGTPYLTYTYYPSGLVHTAQRAGQPAASYTYFADGLLQKDTDPAGRALAYTYNGAGFITSQSDNAGHTTYYTPDNAGNTVAVKDPSGNTTTYSYDGSGALTGETDGANVQYTFAYDSRGHVMSASDPAGTTSYVYNSLGLVQQRTDSNQAVTTYVYDADGNLMQKTRPSSDILNYRYDGLERLTEADDASGELNFAYDANGNKVAQTSCAPQAQGAPCPGNSATASQPTVSLTYTYFANGDEQSVTGPNLVTTYGYDANDLLRTVTDTSGRAFTYTPNAASQVSTLAAPNGVTQSYGYDAAATYYVTDTNGSTIATADGNGTLTARYRYGASGNAPATNGPETTYTFDGSSLDRATGFYHMGDRYYDPATGRFISRDPASSQYVRAPLGNQTRDPYLSMPWTPGTEQRYVFAANDPIDLSDPGGDGFVADIPRAVGAIGCAIVVALSGGAPLVFSQAGVTAVQVCVDDIDALAETSENRGSVTRLLVTIGEEPDFARIAIAVDEADVTGKFLAQAEDVLQLEIDLEG